MQLHVAWAHSCRNSHPCLFMHENICSSYLLSCPFPSLALARTYQYKLVILHFPNVAVVCAIAALAGIVAVSASKY